MTVWIFIGEMHFCGNRTEAEDITRANRMIRADVIILREKFLESRTCIIWHNIFAIGRVGMDAIHQIHKAHAQFNALPFCSSKGLWKEADDVESFSGSAGIDAQVTDPPTTS